MHHGGGGGGDNMDFGLRDRCLARGGSSPYIDLRTEYMFGQRFQLTAVAARLPSEKQIRVVARTCVHIRCRDGDP
jgi:hypothetical protein